MTDGNGEELARGGGSEEDAAWLELIGRFDAPAEAPDAPVPWPERENLGPRAAPAPSAGRPGAAGERTEAGGSGERPAPGDAVQAGERFPAGHGFPAGEGIRAGEGLPASEGLPAGEGFPAGEGTVRGEDAPPAFPLIPRAGSGVPAIPPPQSAGLPASAGPRGWTAPDEEEEHFTPPPPPPLPALSPAAKAAWAGLFGGPGYLLLATLAGWSVPGWALFAAIAAFVGGFTVLALRLGGGSGQDSGPDDGAVV